MKKTQLKFVQVNLHKAKQGQIEIAAGLRKLNKAREAFIALIQEPMTDKSRAILQPKSCQVFEKGPNPRAGIYVSNRLKAYTLSLTFVLVGRVFEELCRLGDMEKK